MLNICSILTKYQRNDNANVYIFILQTGDSLAVSHHQPFVTYDVTYRGDCASELKTGWWIRPDSGHCYELLETNLNGEYKTQMDCCQNAQFDGIIWKNFGGDRNSLKETKMSVS